MVSYDLVNYSHWVRASQTDDNLEKERYLALLENIRKIEKKKKNEYIIIKKKRSCFGPVGTYFVIEIMVCFLRISYIDALHTFKKAMVAFKINM